MRRRKQIRLKYYDYSLSGAYFVTICIKDREELFGNIFDGKVHLNQYGEIVHLCWKKLPKHYPAIILDEFIVMPNHVHFIIIKYEDTVGARHASPLQEKKITLANIVGSFKSAVTKRINEIQKSGKMSIWQRGYYDHIVRNEKSLRRIRDYVLTNPERWEWDIENPKCKGTDEFYRWLKEEAKHSISRRGE